MSRMSTPRKLLLSLMIVGACSSTIGAGTFASFNAQTGNAASFTSGTIVLERTKDAGSDNLGIGSACFSSGDVDEDGDTNVNDDTDDNHKTGCQALMNVEIRRPGDSAYADITLLNVGNLPGNLSVQASQACTTTSSGQSYTGAGNACSGTRLTIQQYETETARNGNDTTNGACWYGGGALTSTCTFAGGSTLTSFSSSHPSSGASPLDMGVMPAGGVRYLRVRLELPENSDNDLQGVQANFGFTWSLVQQT